MHDMLMLRLGYNMAQKHLCEHSKWTTAFGKEVDTSASDFFPYAVSMAQKTSPTTQTEPPCVSQLGLGHDQRGSTATKTVILM